MASFTPDFQPVTPPVSVDDSRLTRGNRAFETLFAGLGDAAVATVKTKEAQIQSDINSQISEGVDAAASGSPGLFETQTREEKEGIPGDIKQAEKQFAKVQRAKQQGTISDSMFVQNVDPLLRRLKSQYPGFTQEIDAAFSRATGSSTANQLRKIRLAEEKALRAEFRKTQTRRDKLLNQAKDIPGAINMSDEMLQFKINEKGVRDAKRAEQVANLALLEKTKKLTSENAASEAINMLDGIWNQSYLQKTEEGRVNPESPVGAFNKKLDDLVASAKDGLSPEEMTAFTADAAALKLQAGQQVDAVLAMDVGGRSLASIIANPAQVKQIKDDFVGRVDRIVDAVTKGDFALLKANDVLIKAGTDQGVLNLRRLRPGITTAEAISKGLGQDAFNTMLLNTQGLKAFQDAQKSLADIAMASMLQVNANIIEGKQDALADGVRTMADSGASSLAHIVTIESVANRLADPKTPADMVAKEIKTQFTDTLLASLNKYKDSNRKPVFLRLTNPRITENLKRANDPEALKQYNDFMNQGFKLLYEADVRVLKEAIEEAPGIAVTWNPKTLQLDTGPSSSFTVGGESGTAQGFFDILKNFRGRNRIKSINSFLSRWGAAQVALGKDSSEASKDMLTLMQETVPELDFGAQKREGPITTFIDSFVRSFEESTGISGGVLTPAIALPQTLGAQAAGTVTGESSPEDTSSLPEPLTKIRDSIAVGEGTAGPEGYKTILGNAQDQFNIDITTKTVDELIEFSRIGGPFAEFSKRQVGRVATPMGKYQIVGTTLKELKKKEGLSGQEIFDENLQDRLFVSLLEKRGLREFQRGFIDKATFVKRLQNEWEGLKKSSRSLEQTVAQLENL